MRYGTFFGGVLVGAALVAAVWLASGPREEGPGGPSVEVRRDGGLDGRLEEVLARLDDIDARLALRPGGTAADSGGGPRLAGAPDAARPEDGVVGLDPEVLATALERAEERREERMTTDELRALARNRMYVQKDYMAARTTLARLLERDLEPEERLDTLTKLGIAHRSAGDHEASVKALEQAVSLSSLDEEKGAWAAFQIVWTEKYAGRPERAAAMGERILSSSHGSTMLNVVTHRALGMFALEGGDTARARRQFESALALAGDNPKYKAYRDEVEGHLRDMK